MEANFVQQNIVLLYILSKVIFQKEKGKEMAEEHLKDSILLVKKYENYKIQKIWGLTLIIIPFANFLILVLFDLFISIAQYSVIILSSLQGVFILIVLHILVISYILSVIRRIEIKEKEIVSSYYKRLGFAILAIVIFYVIILQILMIIENCSEIYPFDKFPFILFGYPITHPLPSGYEGSYLYWGDNLALIIGYLLLKNKNQETKYRELLFGIALLFLYDILSFTIDFFAIKREALGFYSFHISSAITITCGIIAIIRAYKYLKPQ